MGAVEHPVTGGIRSIENWTDILPRDNSSIQEDDLGEESDFDKCLSSTEYGYPHCYATRIVEALPQSGNLSAGAQFAADQRLSE